MPGPNSDPKPLGKTAMKKRGVRRLPFRGWETGAAQPKQAEEQQGDASK